MPIINDDFDPNSNGVLAAITTGLLLGAPETINNTPVALLPEGWTLAQFPQLREQPQRIEQRVTVQTLDSFLHYWNQYVEDWSTVFVDIEAGQVHGILDYHDTGDPGWCVHRVSYPLPQTPEWRSWKAASGKPREQAEFARWIEDHIDDVTDPPGAELLEVARTLEARRNLHFRSGLRLDNGAVQLTYHEEIEGKAGSAGQLTIPTEIKLGMRLVRGGEAYEVKARFRYRIKEGSCVMWFELIRPDRIWDAAVADIITLLHAGMSAGQLIEGTPL